MSYIKKLATLGLLSAVTFSSINVAQAEDAPVLGEDTGKGTVLVDNTHGQTAGAADWVIDGAFSDYGQSIADQGYQVKELRKDNTISEESLKDASILVIPEANIPIKDCEQEAILNFTKNGGSVVFISDHYNADRNLNRIDSSEIMNGYRRGAYNDITKDMSEAEKNSDEMKGVTNSDWLSENFGVRFRYNALNNLKATNIVQGENGLNIGDNVNSVSMHAGSTVAITNPEIAKGIVYMPDNLTESDKWSHAVDQGVYNGGGKKEGAYVAVSKVGKGKAAFIGDSSMVEDSSPKYKREDSGESKRTYDGFKEEDNGQLLKNLTTWLGKKEAYTSFKEKGIELDEKTPLLDFETPENSTEPQKEPWSEPKDGYKWYDPSTFKPGSYGSGEAPTEDPESPSDDPNDTPETNGNATFDLPSQFTAGDTETFTVKLSGYPANQKVSDLKVGMYKAGGEQIGRIAKDGETADSYGYSTPTSVTTDENGNAVLKYTVKVKDGATGEANIRLKQGSKTVTTKQINVQ
ncbi:hypothetical protein [Staphylococcus massiliensis]|uniref:DNA-binding protein n=1 Tax=Staphylococcus massiliensis S46 TaxID=1229783 RepID=K9AMF9_9STAP|nr:hypothetical protein [Staphylococcus massiliensis]EKU48573.1 hypothetical protein C273_05160 [Staphylococcus massiliensis S46]MCG3400126.1 DNA-binding protein [Staphylococcus massiliensis]MCG3413180.1 DNA-binding protein [Staphylococcus massiliensis]POA00625.1 DNA-binding protein [Staphylococcus massiliensis CCUG 55927]